MKAVILPLAVFALIGWTGVSFAQRTCRQQLTSCERLCDNASIQLQGRCRADCQRRHGDAWLRGFGKFQTGKKCDDNGNSPGHAPYAHICGGPMTAR